MGLFNTLMSKIFGASSRTAPAPGTSPTSAAPSAATSPSQAPTGTSTPAAQNVDVAVVLDGLAAKNSEKLDWKRSIVDLMKLVGMDSSLAARKELAAELHYTGDSNDSAKMNIWLHQQVLKKLAQNGGKVPADLLD